MRTEILGLNWQYLSLLYDLAHMDSHHVDITMAGRPTLLITVSAVIIMNHVMQLVWLVVIITRLKPMTVSEIHAVYHASVTSISHGISLVSLSWFFVFVFF